MKHEQRIPTPTATIIRRGLGRDVSTNHIINELLDFIPIGFEVIVPTPERPAPGLPHTRPPQPPGDPAWRI